MAEIQDIAAAVSERDMQVLLRAKVETQNAYMADPGNAVLRRAYYEAKRLYDAEELRRESRRGAPDPAESAPAPAAGRVFRTQLEAVAYLGDAGYKISKSRLNRDFKARKIATNADGHFEESALLAYATVNLTAMAQAENRAQADAVMSRVNADADLKSVQAARFRLKLEQEQGRLMPRVDHERDLAARALFFKREVQNFIHLHGGAIIALVKGDDALLSDLVRYWIDSTEAWMDAWAAEREFVFDADDGEDGDDGAGEGDAE
ncbi:MAG: hypothetical protein LBQ51_05745 [Desulfovibrio sp.]|jgi:hypothetical protein|nr:hypothetical protein [Desulfovibrio sp.]